jgi:hypothetical protein
MNESLSKEAVKTFAAMTSLLADGKLRNLVLVTAQAMDQKHFSEMDISGDGLVDLDEWYRCPLS